MKRVCVFLFLITGTVSGGLALSDVQTKIRQAAEMYTTQPAIALSTLTNLYAQNETLLLTIRDSLFDSQNHLMYRTFLRMLTSRTTMVIRECITMDLLTSDGLALSSDLIALSVVINPQSIAYQYSGPLTDSNTARLLEASLTNREILCILRYCFLIQRKFEQFDRMLMQVSDKSKLDTGELTNYLVGSFMMKTRDIGDLVEAYGLGGNIKTIPMQAISLYMQSRNGEFVRLCEKTDTPEQAAWYRKYSIDLPMLMGQAYLKLGMYQQSINALDKSYFTQPAVVQSLKVLDYLGLDDEENARKAIALSKNADLARFFDAVFDMEGENSNIGILKMEHYVADGTEMRQYLLEAILLIDGYYRSPKDFERIKQAVQNALTYKPVQTAVGTPLADAYLNKERFIEDAKSDSKRIGQFLLYRKARDLIERGETKEAKEILMGLIKSGEISTLIKNLSVYLLRKVSL